MNPEEALVMISNANLKEEEVQTGNEHLKASTGG